MKIKILTGISFTSMHVHVYLHVCTYWVLYNVNSVSFDVLFGLHVQVPVSWSAYLCLNLIIPRLL